MAQASGATPCARCAAFAAETRVPAEACGQVGAPIAVCWLCAHVLCHHDAVMTYADLPACKCALQEIYPERDFVRLPVLCHVDPVPAPPVDLGAREERIRVARVELTKAEQALAEAKGPVSSRMPARERQAQNRAAAASKARGGAR